MQIQPINYVKYNSDKIMQKNPSFADKVSFSGGKQQLEAVVTDNFKTETAKKLFTTMQKYYKMLSGGGRINEVKILSENLEFYNYKTNEKFSSVVDTLMSIQKNPQLTIIRLYRMYPNKFKHCIFDAVFDSDGQMTEGEYKIPKIKFERKNGNIRRMEYLSGSILPYGDNDREWVGLSAECLPIYQRYGDNSTRGMYEIFIELARLYTTLNK